MEKQSMESNSLSSLTMDLMHSSGVSATMYLQTHYRHTQDYFLYVSMATDLRNTFFLIFPIWFHLRQSVAVKLVWIAVVGDWLNLILKWCLFGERPYWWVKETGYYGNSSQPMIQQFPMTCETGPGSPSGHAMGAAGVYYAMMSSIIVLKEQGSGLMKWCLHGSLWTVFWFVQVCVCLSRVFLAAHFPHQVIFGVIIGVLVAEIFNRVRWIYNASLCHYFYVSLLLLSLALFLYLVLLKWFDVDLLWTLEKARRWCLRPEWINMDTSPFASLFRNTGTLFGLGLGLHSPLFSEARRLVSNSQGGAGAVIYRYRFSCVSATLIVLHLLDSFRPPANARLLFYLLSFCKSAMVPLATVAIIPYCVAITLGYGGINKPKGES